MHASNNKYSVVVVKSHVMSVCSRFTLKPVRIGPAVPATARGDGMPTVEKDKVSMRTGLGGMTQSYRHAQHGEGYEIAVRKLMIMLLFSTKVKDQLGI